MLVTRAEAYCSESSAPDFAFLPEIALMFSSVFKRSAKRAIARENRARTALTERIDALANDSNVAVDLLSSLRAELFGQSPISSIENAPMKVGFIASAKMPSRAANNVSVLKMCDAISKTGVDLALVFEIARGEHQQTLVKALSGFGVVDPFQLTGVRCARAGCLAHIHKTREILKISCTSVVTRCPYCAFFAALAGLPTLLELHRPVEKKFAGYVSNYCRLPTSTGIVAISERLARSIADDLGNHKTKIYVLRSAADESPLRHSTFPLIRATDSQINVGYAGHLYAGKAMEIISRLAERLKDARFHIVGGMDEDIARWKSATQDLKNIEYYGYWPHSEIYSFLQSVDILIAPYQQTVLSQGGKHDISTWMSPLKIIEYMAAEKPIVSSNLPSIREILEHGKTALLCEPNDIASWTDAITRLAANLPLSRSLAQSARAQFEQQFTWSQRASKMLNILADSRPAHMV